MLELGLWEEDLIDTLPIKYYPNFFKDHCANKADEFFEYSQKLNWQQYRSGYGQTKNPRLEVAYGDSGIMYQYGNIVLKAMLWDPWLKRLGEVITERTGYSFNFCIGNYYRNGDDSIGWHGDRDNVLGVKPVIASISLGANRKFQIRRKSNKKIDTIRLEHGSLLIMQAGCQEDYEHQLPKDNRIFQPRINWTYRMAKK